MCWSSRIAPIAVRAALMLSVASCSASSGDRGHSTSGAPPAVPRGAGGAVAAASPSSGAPLIGATGGTPSAGAAPGVEPEGCGIVLQPERIIGYEPIGMFIMQDRSGSMITGYPPPASPFSWATSTAAVTAFVNDPSSAGLHIGLGAFPPVFGPIDCRGGSDCGVPVVAMAELPANAAAMVQGMQLAFPANPAALTPTECGLRGMVNHCTAFTAATKLPCVGVLVTDGNPTLCDTSMATLAPIVAAGASQGMQTFVVGLPGANLFALNALAQAGGTGAAIGVDVNGAAAFIAALNQIRGAITLGSPLQCQWRIPPPPDNLVFDPAKMNVSFVEAGGAARVLGFAAAADCATTLDSWYFDDPANPTQIILCPGTCETLKAAAGATVNVAFGCSRKAAIAR